jgi:hypothetical protein
MLPTKETQLAEYAYIDNYFPKWTKNDQAKRHSWRAPLPSR